MPDSVESLVANSILESQITQTQIICFIKELYGENKMVYMATCGARSEDEA